MDLYSATESLREFLGTPVFFFVGDFVLTLQNLLLASVSLAAAWLLALWAKRLATRFFSAESEEEAGGSAVAEPVAYWSLMGAGILVSLHFLGIDMAIVRDALNAHLFAIGGNDPVTLFTLLFAALVVALSWVLSRLLRRALDRSFRVRQVDEGSTAITKRLLHYAVVAIGVMLALQNLGVNLGALFAAGAIFAVGLGFAMQTIAENFVSGLILLVERSIKPGDVLEVDTRVVVVEKMGIRATVARTRDEEEIIIPNSSLVQNTVKNYTLRDSLYRVRVLVGVQYGSDMREVREVLQAAAATIEWRFPGREPAVLLREFGDSSVVWDVSVWMSDPWASQRARSDLHEAVWFALQDAGITIAFPQLDVHFDPPFEAAVERLPKAS